MKNFLDFQSFLVSPHIFFIFVVSVLTMMQYFALSRQVLSILKKRSTESVSFLFFFWQFFFFLGLLSFGVLNKSVSAIILGSLAFPSIPIIILIFIFEKKKIWSLVSFMLGLGAWYMFLNIGDSALYLFVLFAMFVIALLSQTLIIPINRSRGSLDLLFVLVSFASALLSWLYSTALDNIIVQSFTGLVLLSFAFTYFFYKKFD